MNALTSISLTSLAMVFGLAAYAQPVEKQFDSFIEYCEEDNNSDMALYTLDILGAMAKNTRCTAIEAYLADKVSFTISAPGLTEVTAFKFFDKLESLTIESTQPVLVNQLKGIKNLGALSVIAPIKAIGTISPALKTLEITGAPGVALAGIEGNFALKSLSLVSSPKVDLAPLAKAQTLSSLTIADAGLTDMSSFAVLKGNTELVHIDVSDNEISDMSALKDFPLLAHFAIVDNQVVDLTPLAGKANLFALDLTGNGVVSLAALKDNTAIRYLQMGENPLGTSVAKTADNCPTTSSSPAIKAWCSE